MSIIDPPLPIIHKEPIQHAWAHRKWSWSDEQGWIKLYRLPFALFDGWTKYPANPVFQESGVGGTFDELGVVFPCVIRVGNAFYMYYGGQQLGGDAFGNSIGVAESPDGITWTRMNAGLPILTPTGGAWDQSIVRNPAVIYDEVAGIYKMWYIGIDTVPAPDVWQIGYATANNPDGPWTKWPANPIYNPNPGAINWAGMAVLRMGNLYYMALPNGAITQYEAHYSANGTAWTNWSAAWATPLIGLGGVGAWDAVQIRFGTLFWNQGRVYLFYSGLDAGGLFRTGMAMASNEFSAFTKWGNNDAAFNPVLSTWGAFTRAISPSLLQVDDVFNMWFNYYNGGAPKRVGLATIP